MDFPLLARITISDWIAAVALIFSAWAAWTSRQSLTISRRHEQRQLSPLDLYLADAFIHRLVAKEHRVYVFSIVLTNGADAPNSLRSAELEVRHVRNGKPAPPISIPHRYDPVGNLSLSVPILAVPSSIAARGVLAGAVTFDVPGEIIVGVEVDSYCLRISDALGRVSEVEVIFLQERNHAE